MHKNLNLNGLFAQYVQGTVAKKDLEGAIFTFILENHQQLHLFRRDKDRCADFLTWFYPRMSRAIDAYQNVGATFEAYITSLMRWAAREYQSRQADRDLTESTFWETQAKDLSPSEAEPAYLEPEKTLKPLPNPRQTLVLLLKTYAFVSDQRIEQIAPLIGLEPAYLQGLMDELRRRRSGRDEAIRGLSDRVYCQYYRCMVLRKKLAVIPEGSGAYEKRKAQLIRAERRYSSMKKRLSSMSCYATNREVAEVLGIPKGTVDSTLYAIKRKYQSRE